MSKKIKITLDTDSVEKHRYKSIDDWSDPIKEGEKTHFRAVVGDMGNMDYDFLVLIHALVEQYLCFRHGIKDKEVSDFDKQHIEHENPGDLEDAPYHNEHSVATDVEALVSVALNVNWLEYEKTIEKTLKKYDKAHNKRKTSK